MANDTKNMPNQSWTEKHRHSLLDKLVALKDNKELCDVTITVENKEFQAHKNVLSASSDYFRTMFTSEFQEKNCSEIKLEGRSASFDRLLGFAYTGRLDYKDLSMADAIDTLNMAAYLQLENAVKIVSQFLLRAIECELAKPAEVYRIWELADLLSKGMDIEELAMTALDFLVKHFIEFAQLESFKSNTSVEFLQKCLLRNGLAAIMPELKEGKGEAAGKQEEAAASEGMKTEEVAEGMEEGAESERIKTRWRREEKILDITMLWLFHDWSNLKANAYNLLKMIRLGLVSEAKCQQVLDTAIGEITDCRQHLVKLMNGQPIADEKCWSDCFMLRDIVIAPVLLDAGTNAVHIYNIKAKYQWQKSTPNFEPNPFETITRYSCLAIDNHLYVCGGINHHGITSGSLCRYDLTEYPKQLVLSSMKYPRSNFAMVQLDHHIYVIGGIDSKLGSTDSDLKEVEKYDINMVRYDTMLLENRVNPWVSAAVLPGSCWRPHGVTYKGNILCCGLSERPPRVHPMRRAHEEDDIEYVLYMYNPSDNRWQRHILLERPVVHCMGGMQNKSKLLVHDGETYLVGTREVTAVVNPNRTWFRLTVNKLMLREEGHHLRFASIGEEICQDRLDYEHFDKDFYSAFFYIGSDLFCSWGNDVLKLQDLSMTSSNLKEKLNAFYTGKFMNKMSQSYSMAQVDIKYLKYGPTF